MENKIIEELLDDKITKTKMFSWDETKEILKLAIQKRDEKIKKDISFVEDLLLTNPELDSETVFKFKEELLNKIKEKK